MSTPTSPTGRQYRPSRLLRWLPVAGLLCVLVFALVALSAAVFEGVDWGWWTAAILMALAGYFAFNYWQAAYTVTLQHDHLSLRRFGRETTLPYDRITRAELGRSTLILHTPERKIGLYGEPNGLAEGHAVLEARAARAPCRSIGERNGCPIWFPRSPCC